MKGMILFLSMIWTVAFAVAQKKALSDVKHQLKDGNFQAALTMLDSLATDAEVVSQMDYWILRGDAALRLYDQNSRFETLEASYEAYFKSLSYATASEGLGKIRESLLDIRRHYRALGTQAFQSKSYTHSLVCFERAMLVSSRLLPGQVDTISLFNAGLAAEKASKYALALEYIERFEALGSFNPELCNRKANVLNALGRKAEAIALCKSCIEQYPNRDADLVLSMINFHLSGATPEDAIPYLQIALGKDPRNQHFHYTLARLYERKQRFADARKSYQKALEINPDFFEANYQMAVMFYNIGVELMLKAVSDEDRENARNSFKQALPYAEKAHEVNPKHTQTNEMLLSIYEEIQMYKEAKALRAGLN